MPKEKKNYKIENLSAPFTIANIQRWINHKNIAKDWNFTWWVFEETKVRKKLKKKDRNLNSCCFCSKASSSRQESQEANNTAHYRNFFLHFLFLSFCVCLCFECLFQWLCFVLWRIKVGERRQWNVIIP